MTRPFRVCGFGVALLIVSFGGSSENTLNPARVGRWEGPCPNPLDAIHAVLLPTSTVLMSS